MVVLIGVGSLVTLGLGIWLADDVGYGLGDGWVIAAIVLWALSGALAAPAGTTLRHARELAEQLAADGDRPSEELRRAVGDRARARAQLRALRRAVGDPRPDGLEAGGLMSRRRPTDWNWLLLLHLLGDVRSSAACSPSCSSPWRPSGGPGRSRCRSCARSPSARTSIVVLPGFVAVHVFGDLLAGREYKHGDPDWLYAGFAITDIALIVGGVILTLAPVLGASPHPRRPAGRVASGARDRLPWFVLAALVAVIVLMAGKPVG